jgi:hypothetical protein
MPPHRLFLPRPDTGRAHFRFCRTWRDPQVADLAEMSRRLHGGRRRVPGLDASVGCVSPTPCPALTRRASADSRAAVTGAAAYSAGAPRWHGLLHGDRSASALGLIEVAQVAEAGARQRPCCRDHGSRDAATALVAAAIAIQSCGHAVMRSCGHAASRRACRRCCPGFAGGGRLTIRLRRWRQDVGRANRRDGPPCGRDRLTASPQAPVSAGQAAGPAVRMTPVAAAPARVPLAGNADSSCGHACPGVSTGAGTPMHAVPDRRDPPGTVSPAAGVNATACRGRTTAKSGASRWPGW